MVHKTRLLLIVLFSSLVIVSCLTVETEITLNKDGSGTADFQYNLTTLALDINNTDKDKNILSFPILLNDYEKSAQEIGGILITNYNMSDDGSRYFITSDIVFESLLSLSAFTGLNIVLEDLGNNKLLTVEIYEGTDGISISDQSLGIVNENFSKEFFSFKITIPGEIVRVEGATFSNSTVSFKTNIEELLNSSETVQFSVEYR